MDYRIGSVMDYETINKQVADCKENFCLELFEKKRKSFQIKKEKTIAKNLERIFSAALSISNKKSFHAMSMRDLSKESKLSIGALYNYFSGKEALLEMMQMQRRTITRRILNAHIAAEENVVQKLHIAVRTHLYLSEAMQPWFYFSFMEAKNLSPKGKQAAVQSELYTEQIFADIIEAGRNQGLFKVGNSLLAASLIKAMLQDWYLKRPKYAQRQISVDHYAQFMIGLLEKSMGVHTNVGKK